MDFSAQIASISILLDRTLGRAYHAAMSEDTTLRALLNSPEPEIRELARIYDSKKPNWDGCSALLMIVRNEPLAPDGSDTRVVQLVETLAQICRNHRHFVLDGTSNTPDYIHAAYVAGAGELYGFHDPDDFARMCERAGGGIEEFDRQTREQRGSSTDSAVILRRARVWAFGTIGHDRKARRGMADMLHALLKELRLAFPAGDVAEPGETDAAERTLAATEQAIADFEAGIDTLRQAMRRSHLTVSIVARLYRLHRKETLFWWVLGVITLAIFAGLTFAWAFIATLFLRKFTDWPV